MSIPKNKWKYIAFSSIFKYLYVIKEGYVDIEVGSSETIELPEGYDIAMWRVFEDNTNGGDPSEYKPTIGFFATGTDARIVPGEGLVITAYGGGGFDPDPPTIRFHYFIYGGDYSDD